MAGSENPLLVAVTVQDPSFPAKTRPESAPKLQMVRSLDVWLVPLPVEVKSIVFPSIRVPVTVNADGLVTAGSSGTAVISAMNEGALGLVMIRVVLTGDSDGDRIPDDVELDNGLNPNDAVDALLDSDGDGLTNG